MPEGVALNGRMRSSPIRTATAIWAILLLGRFLPLPDFSYGNDIMWMIQKIGVDAYGEIDRVQWQSADTTANAWVGEPEIVSVIEVVDAVVIGRVGSVIPSDGGGSVQGPYLRTFVQPGGVEGVEADPANNEDRSLFDLPRLTPDERP